MKTSELITEEDDKTLRAYAKRLHNQDGEDAYHNAVCSLLGYKDEIQNVQALGIVVIRKALHKIWRHEQAERKNIEHYINNDPIPAQQGLEYGRQKQLKCRKKLHDLVEGNLVYVGARRTCLSCMQIRQLQNAVKRREKKT